jgi:integrase
MPQHIQVLYSRKLSEGLSTSTVRHIHEVLHRALKDALLMGLVQRNVSEMVRAPRRSSREMMTLTDTQVKQLLEAERGERFEAMYFLALTAGMHLDSS